MTTVNPPQKKWVRIDDLQQPNLPWTKKNWVRIFLDPNGPQLRGAGWNSQLHFHALGFFLSFTGELGQRCVPEGCTFSGGGGSV